MKKIYWICRFYIFLLVLGTLLVPLFFPESNWQTDVQNALQGPSANHWFGTDSLGRDLFFRTINGAKVSLYMGILCSFFALLIGVIYGGISGWLGGLWDQILMRMMEIILSLPQIVTIGLMVLFMSSKSDDSFALVSFLKLAVAISLGSWMIFARLTRNLVLREKSLLYVESAIAIGATPQRVLTHEIFPNLLPSLLVMFGLQIPNFLLFESFLSFMGIGIHPPLSSWGLLIQEGWKSMLAYPHLLGFPALILFFTVFSLNVVFEQFRHRLMKPFAAVDLHH